MKAHNLLVLMALLASPAQAQQRQPANVSTLPQSSPQEFDLLDKNGNYLPFFPGAKDVFVRNYGPYNDFVGDDGPAIAAAITAAVNAGGGTVYLDQKSYWNQTKALVVPRGVRLTCVGYFTRIFVSGQDQNNFPCTIYQKAGASLEDDGAVTNLGVMSDQVHFNPMIPATRAQMEAFIAGFAGTGVTMTNAAGNQALLQNVFVGGFATCIAINGAQQVTLRDILGDCTNGLDISNSHDINSLFAIEFWETLTTNRAHTFDHWTISSIADNGSGLFRITTSAANDLVTGEKIWIAANGAGGAGANGQWTVTVIDSTHFDLQGSASAPTTTGATTAGATYVTVASTANLSSGMTVSDGGVNIPAGATIQAVWRTRNAISLDQNHTAITTASGVALNFASSAYTGAAGTVSYDGTWRTGTGFAIGAADGTMCSQCFAFGYQIGFNFRGAISTGFINAQYDQVAGVFGVLTPHMANQNLTPIGVEFTGQSWGNIFKGSLITYAGVGVLGSSTIADTGDGNTVESERIASSSNYGTFLESGAGGITVKNAGSTNGGNILIDDSASTTQLIGLHLPAAVVSGVSYPPIFYAGRNLLGGGIDQNSPAVISAHKFVAAGPYSSEVDWYNSGQSLNSKYWRWYSGGSGVFCLQALNDAFSTANNALCANRTGTTVTGLALSAPLTAPVTVSGAVSGAQSGLVIATGDGFAEGGQITMTNTNSGATAPNKYLRVSNSGQLQILNSGYSGIAFSLDDVGNTTVGGAMAASAVWMTAALTIATLPTCNSGLKGYTTFVTNAQTTPPYLGAVSTTGAVTAPVFCNGSGWVYH